MLDAPLRPVDDLLDRAAQLSEPERSAFLDRECGDDLALRQELDDLLAIDTSQLAEVDRPVFELIPTDIDAQPSVLGPFHLEEELGRGGTAVVYRAQRQDGVDNRPVAIKLLHPGASREESLKRIQREGDILSSLQHPNIARVFGGGVAPDGRPYLVMELVEGEPIDRFCDRKNLSLRERIRLLMPLLSAVQYAHSKLVVHRDLKPDNVLVTSSGEIKVLDFGVAKLLRQPNASHSTVTQYGLRMLTPEYAAPEQLSMAPVSVAADVYSLGVMLYELLTGKRPFERAQSPATFLQKVLNQPPPPPSSLFGQDAQPDQAERATRRRASPKSLRQLLRDDLDSVTSKALSKTPSERYVSVLELQQDLTDFLENRPVRAARGRLLYRAGKFLRRRRRVVLAASLVFLAAGGWIVDREQSRQEIVVERNKAQAAEELMKAFLTHADPYNRAAGVESTVASVMEHSRTQVDLSLVPEVEVSLLETLARIYGNDGDYERCNRLLQEAIDLLSNTPGISPERLRSVRVALANSWTLEGRYQEAVDALREVADDLPPEDSYERARTLASFSRALLFNGQIPESRAIADDVFALIKRLPQDIKVRSLTIEVLLQRSQDQQESKDFAGAEATLRIAVGNARKEWGNIDRRVQYLESALAETILLQERHEDALALMETVLTNTIELRGPVHRDTGREHLRLGRILHAMGRIDEARAQLQQAVDVLNEAVGPDNRRTQEAQQALDEVNAAA